MILASQWYSSGTFWAAAGTIAVLVTGAAATVVALWLANPVRRLECVMSSAPLLQGSAQEMSGSLQITWDGVELKDPHILEVNLISRGRRDISSEDFDQPLEFRVGAKILAVLRTASGPKSSTFRAVAFEDDLLKVGPGLIRRHQSIKFTLLAVGRDPMLSSSAAALRDVDVEVVSTDESHRRWSVKVKLAGCLAATAVTAGLILIGLLIGHNPSSSGTPSTDNQNQTATASLAKASLRTAEADLKSDSQTSQLGGIKTLQGIMKTSPSDQPAAIRALSSFVHARSAAGNNDQPVTAVIQAALNVLRGRNPVNDGSATINLDNTNLTSANLSGINFSNASLVNADFSDADLDGTNLHDANLNYAFVGGANLADVNLDGANLTGASFYQTTMCHGSAPTQPQRGYDCSANG
jgi:hypothetical protein